MTELLAQYNLSMLKAPPEELADFLAEVERVNAVGDTAPGFRWRYATPVTQETGAAGNSLDDTVGDYIINYTVWESMDDVWNFTFSGDHLDMLRRRRDWFVPGEMTNILWWFHHHDGDPWPSLEEAEARMCHYWENGPTPVAFTWKTAPLRTERGAGIVSP